MQIIPRNNAPKPGGPYGRIPKLTKRELQHRMARQAAIDRTKARYLKMVCGHYQTLEDDERVSHWRPRKGVTWCETCNEWLGLYVPPISPDYGDTPLF